MGNKLIGIICICAVGILFTGCHSSKTVSSGSHKKMEEVKKQDISESTYRYLSEKLGVEVTGKDDIGLFESVARWIGTPYKYGGSTRKGTDCSGFVVSIYSSVYRKQLARSSADIRQKNCKEIPKSKLQSGDLVFFATGKNKKKVNHVGIYLKNNKFIHASSSKGVIVSSMKEAYYVKTYVSSGKVN